MFYPGIKVFRLNVTYTSQTGRISCTARLSLLKAQTLVKIFHPFFHSAKSRANNYVIRSVFFALSGTSGIWYRTLILIFLNFVLFFTLNAHRKIVNNECENPGEAQKECTPPWRRQPSPPACNHCEKYKEVICSFKTIFLSF